ncbi:MAG TPA: aminoglycoside phosphotransferase family protein [Microlunatus sp.]|nr:aminoglycoside phosphotransferase family protein [Microlunatus sp.]
MTPSEARRAIAAARGVAATRGLVVDDAVVLHNSNKLTVRLLPCDVVARIAPATQQNADFEVDLARRLVAAECPVGALDSRGGQRAHERDGFVLTLWTYYPPWTADPIGPAEYAGALHRLHRGMRTVDVPTPHFTDRVAEAQQLLADPERTPALAGSDRVVLADTLRGLRRSIVERATPEQLLHGEPHPGNLLATQNGPLFIDLETCCRGPIEFDLAHAPDEVSDHYPDVDHHQLRDCRLLMLAMIITWRWDRDDQLPNGRERGLEWLDQLRAALEH